MEISGLVFWFFVFALTVIIAMSTGGTVRHEDQPCTVFEKGIAKTQACNLAARKSVDSGHPGCVSQMREEAGELPGITEVAPTLTGLTGLGLEYGLLCRHSYLTNQ